MVLALEHQLLDRARYLEALADTAEHADIRNLARRLQAAHQETVDWMTSVLIEQASGQLTKVQPTPVQTALSRLTSVLNYPARWTVEWINGTAPRTVLEEMHFVRIVIDDAADFERTSAASLVERTG